MPPTESRAARWRGIMLSMDWQFIKGSSIISVGIALARVIGFAFAFLLARAFSTEDYGYVQYQIALANLVTIGTIPFAQHVLPWFISRHKADSSHLREVTGSVWFLMLALCLGTLAIAIPLLALMNRLNVGVIVIAAGLTLFAIYAGLARGFLASGRMLLMYLSSNVVQLVAVLLSIRVLGTQSTTPVLIIYGLSYVVPILVLLLARPFDIDFRIRPLRREVLDELIRFAVPNWVSHALFSLFFALDILLLERYWDEATVGIYGLTKTIVLVFSFFPQGITMILLPKVAGSRDGQHRAVLVNSLGINLAISLVSLVIFLSTYEWFLVSFIGDEYFIGMDFALIMAASAIIFGLHAIVTSYLVGRSLPGLETISRAVIIVVTLTSGLALIPTMGAIGAAWSALLSAIIGTLTYPVLLLQRRLVRPQ